MIKLFQYKESKAFLSQIPEIKTGHEESKTLLSKTHSLLVLQKNLFGKEQEEWERGGAGGGKVVSADNGRIRISMPRTIFFYQFSTSLHVQIWDKDNF